MISLLSILFALYACFVPGEALPTSQEYADWIIENAKFYVPENSAQALAIKSNRILSIGSLADMSAHIGPMTKRLDVKGATVTPGFIDSHVHFLSGSLGLAQIDLSEADSIEAIQARILAFHQEHPKQASLVGRGWVYGTFPEGLPHKKMLDAIVDDRPVVMKCYDGHTLWVNSRALQAANISRQTLDPKGGQIVRDPVSGEPTGVLKENAVELMDNVIPEPTRNEKLGAIKAGIARAHQYGITSVFDASVERADLELFEELRKAGELPLRFTFALSGKSKMTESDADQLRTIKRSFPELNIPAVKLFVDGVIEAHTAVLLSAYANRPTLGLPETNAQDLNRIVAMLDHRGWQIIVHAIGDGGIRMTLDAFERSQSTKTSPAMPARHRIEHVEAISAQDIERFGRLGVIASMQPYHANPNSNIFSVWAVNLGEERASRAWAWKSISDAGGRLAFGSDWPVVSLDPRLGLHTALTRQTLQGLPANGFVSQQRLPLNVVLDAYTSGAAYAEFAEKMKGSLAPGMLADIVVWDCDLFSLAVDKVHTAKVDTTIFDGQIVYRAARSSSSLTVP
jgi:predicted amidohydrolase YtcJ